MESSCIGRLLSDTGRVLEHCTIVDEHTILVHCSACQERAAREQASAFKEATLLWRGPKRPARLRPVLGRAEIVRAAMDIADAEGLEAVSMRRIAASLGFGATSLYWYVKSKEELFQLMFDAYIGEDEVPPQTSDGWREYAKQLAIEARVAMRRHPWVPRLGIQLGLGPESLRYYRAATSIFVGFGLEPERLSGFSQRSLAT